MTEQDKMGPASRDDRDRCAAGPIEDPGRCRCRRYSRWDLAQGWLLVLMIPALALGFVVILVRIFASASP